MRRRRSRLRLDAKVQTLSSSFGYIVLYAEVAALVASEVLPPPLERHCIDVMTCRTGQTIERIQRALEVAGIVFIEQDGRSGPGVRLRKPIRL